MLPFNIAQLAITYQQLCHLHWQVIRSVNLSFLELLSRCLSRILWHIFLPSAN